MITTLLVACLPALATSITLPASSNDVSYSCFNESPASFGRQARMKDCAIAAALLPSLIEPLKFVVGSPSDRGPEILPVSATHNTCRVRVDLQSPQSSEIYSWSAINVATLQIMTACSSKFDPRDGNDEAVDEAVVVGGDEVVIVGGQKFLGRGKRIIVKS